MRHNAVMTAGIGQQFAIAGGKGFKAMHHGLRIGLDEPQGALTDIGPHIQDHRGRPALDPPRDDGEFGGFDGFCGGHLGLSGLKIRAREMLKTPPKPRAWAVACCVIRNRI